MKREIKFRAWDKQRKVMVFPYDAMGRMGDFGFYIPLIDSVLVFNMQYTGREDKNGKKIYEGDIVDDLNHEARGVVEWDVEGCDYNIVDGKGKFIQAFGLENSIYEVLGSRYENPELLAR